MSDVSFIYISNMFKLSTYTPSERTNLLPNQPAYVFGIRSDGDRRKRLRRFQCCLCGIFLSIFFFVLAGTIFYTIGVNDDNSTDATNTTDIIPTNSFIILLNKEWPLDDTNDEQSEEDENEEDWNEAIKAGENALQAKDDVEENLPPIPIHSPSFRHRIVMSTSERARNISRIGIIEEHAAKFLNKKYGKQSTYKFRNTSADNFVSNYCNSPKIICNEFHKYRTYNGTCNNLKNPNKFGVTLTPFRRALNPDYADGVNSPRESKSSTKLPSARTVSLIVHRPFYRNDPKFTVMLAVFGQFLDHDITATALSQKSNGDSISCCQNIERTSPECFPVIVDNGDPFLEYNVSCIEFIRSASAPKCYLGPREQINQATAFIDGSVVYGLEEDDAKNLRTLDRGLLKMFVTKENRTLLPLSEDLNDGCNRLEERDKGRYCFITGDARANENLHLTSMHLIWARNHNFIASELAKVNPDWSDETLYQEARRILGAQMQHITYNEFLPILLGPNMMEKFELAPKRSGYFNKYSESMDPSIANNFATAAFRFAHSIIPGLMKLLANDTSSPEFVSMHKMLFDPFKLYQPEELDRTIRGAMNTTIEATDSYFTNELKQHMFEKPEETRTDPKKCGLDLVSLNIQRGRDHGLPGYIYWRNHCGLSKARSFDDLQEDFDQTSWRNIKSIYRTVEDIDLYTGALSEIPLEDSILGPTLTCLILDQFVRIKHGDRFWYENGKFPAAFTPQQLKEIRKTSLARIICDNSDNIDTIQPLVMERIRKGNEYVPCKDIKKIDFNHWKEKRNKVTMASEFINVISKPKN